MTTQNQIAALKYLIFAAKDGTHLSKRILSFLIDESEALTKEVCLSLVANREGYTGEEISAAADGVFRMSNSNCSTHLGEIVCVMGVNLKFSAHYGDFDPSRGDCRLNCDGIAAGRTIQQVYDPGLTREGMPIRYTFWLSKNHYSEQATLVVATLEKLNQIDLAKPGLYPYLEQSA